MLHLCYFAWSKRDFIFFYTSFVRTNLVSVPQCLSVQCSVRLIFSCRLSVVGCRLVGCRLSVLGDGFRMFGCSDCSIVRCGAFELRATSILTQAPGPETPTSYARSV